MEQALIPLGFGVASGAATYLGGWLALAFQRHASLLLGLAAGVVLGVALFDLVPEAIDAMEDATDGSAEHGPRSPMWAWGSARTCCSTACSARRRATDRDGARTWGWQA